MFCIHPGRVMKLLSRCCVILLFVLPNLWGQGTQVAQISGTVRDASGGAIPGAEVKVIQTSTGMSRSVTTGSDGSFVVSSLPRGPVSAGGLDAGIQHLR